MGSLGCHADATGVGLGEEGIDPEGKVEDQ